MPRGGIEPGPRDPRRDPATGTSARRSAAAAHPQLCRRRPCRRRPASRRCGSERASDRSADRRPGSGVHCPFAFAHLRGMRGLSVSSPDRSGAASARNGTLGRFTCERHRLGHTTCLQGRPSAVHMVRHRPQPTGVGRRVVPVDGGGGRAAHRLRSGPGHGDRGCRDRRLRRAVCAGRVVARRIRFRAGLRVARRIPRAERLRDCGRVPLWRIVAVRRRDGRRHRGHPAVGPAARLLVRADAAAGGRRLRGPHRPRAASPPSGTRLEARQPWRWAGRRSTRPRCPRIAGRRRRGRIGAVSTTQHSNRFEARQPRRRCRIETRESPRWS